MARLLVFLSFILMVSVAAAASPSVTALTGQRVVSLSADVDDSLYSRLSEDTDTDPVTADNDELAVIAATLPTDTCLQSVLALSSQHFLSPYCTAVYPIRAPPLF